MSCTHPSREARSQQPQQAKKRCDYSRERHNRVYHTHPRPDLPYVGDLGDARNDEDVESALEEPEEGGEEHDRDYSLRKGPKYERGEAHQDDARNHRVVAPITVRERGRYNAPKDSACVEDCERVESGLWVHSVRNGVVDHIEGGNEQSCVCFVRVLQGERKEADVPKQMGMLPVTKSMNLKSRNIFTSNHGML